MEDYEISDMFEEEEEANRGNFMEIFSISDFWRINPDTGGMLILC